MGQEEVVVEVLMAVEEEDRCGCRCTLWSARAEEGLFDDCWILRNQVTPTVAGGYGHLRHLACDFRFLALRFPS